jgi:hypothetical protein
MLVTQYVPTFKCKYCGETKESIVNGDQGIFVPCDCEESRKQRDQDHYLMMERRKAAKRQSK